MALTDARAILPALATVEADPAGDSAALDALAGWCGRYTPWVAGDPVQAGGGAGLLLDITGCAHLFGGEEGLATDLLRRLGGAGYAASLAIADTPGAAWGMARFALMAKGPAVIVPPDGMRDALAPLSVAALRLDAATVAGLTALGLRVVGDLYALPRSALTRRTGDKVVLRLDQALGRVAEPISPLMPVPRHQARLAFAEPIGHTDDLSAALDRLAAELCASLEAAGQGARRLVLTLFEPAGRAIRLAVGTSKATRDPAHLVRLFAEHLDTVEAPFGIDAMMLAAATTEALALRQAGMRAASPETPDGLAGLIDRLANRLGADQVYCLAPRDSHVPERAEAAVPALAGALRAAPLPGAEREDPVAARPLRLLTPPEEIEAVAAIPDSPPSLFRWRRVMHRVTRAEGPERIAPEWWCAAAQAVPDAALDGDAAAAETRDYYRVEDEAGRRFWLYRRGLYDGAVAVPPQWFLHGIFG